MGKSGWAALALTILCCVGCADPGGSSEEDPELDPRFLNELSADGLSEYGYFGNSVAIDGDYAIVGCPYESTETLGDSGAAYVYERSGSGWIQVAKLSASDAASKACFGSSVGISGERAIVGAPYASSETVSSHGAAYVFTRTESGWEQDGKLLASDAAAYDCFGQSVAIDGGYAIIGATSAASGAVADCGAAYAFEYEGGAWSQAAKLAASDAAPSDYFGAAVALDGIFAIVGASQKTLAEVADYAGAAYVFTRTASGWEQSGKLTASDAAASDVFGSSVALEGSRAVVGARYAAASEENAEAGAAYVFNCSGTAWTQAAKLLASDGADYDSFGFSVALRGGCILVGAPRIKTGLSGGVYLFAFADGGWPQLLKLTPAEGTADDFYGYSVALDEKAGIIGAPRALAASEAMTGMAELWSLY